MVQTAMLSVFQPELFTVFSCENCRVLAHVLYSPGWKKKKKKRHHSTCLDEPTTCSTNQTTEEINKVLGLVSNKVFLLMQTAPATMCMSRNVKGTLLGDGTQRFIPVRQ